MNRTIKTAIAAMALGVPAAVVADDARVTGEAQPEMGAAAATDRTPGGLRVVDNAEIVVTDRASNWMGLEVTDLEGEMLGSVNDMILDADHRVTDLEVGVGGFLGIGETNVLIPLDRISVVTDHDADSVALTASVSRDELEALIDEES